MMKRWLLLLPMMGGMACQSPTETTDVSERTDSISTVDVYADYPMKRLDISELAEVAYLPLNKKRLIKNRSYHGTFTGNVSENLIVSYTFDGDVEIFNHSGQKLHEFNHQQVNEEGSYIGIHALSADEERQEVWILDYDHSFKIYALDGTYRRTLKVPESLNVQTMRNWSEDSLLCYDDHLVAEGLSRNAYPFYLFSKRDGGIRKLTSVRVSNRINHSERFVLDVGGTRQVLNFTLSVSPLAIGGGRAILADFAKDTMFCFQQGVVSPLFVRKPSVFASLPFVLGSVDFVTSHHLFFSFAEKTQGNNSFERNLLYDFETKEVTAYQLLNNDFEPCLSLPVNSWKSNYPSNWLVNEMSADRFLQYHREEKLKGKATEVAEKIRKTDTSVLILYKFHDK